MGRGAIDCTPIQTWLLSDSTLPEFGFAYVFCGGCCHHKWGVKVEPTKYKGEVGLGLFASKDLLAGRFICDFSWDMQTGNDCLFF